MSSSDSPLSFSSFTSFLSSYRVRLSLSPSADRPFDHLYSARELIHQYKAKIEEKSADESDAADDAALLPRSLAVGLLDCLLGVNEVEAEEIGVGARRIEAAIKELKFTTENQQFAFVSLEGENGLAVVWAGRGEFDRSLSYLAVAQSTFFSALRSGLTKQQMAPFAAAHTRTVFYLAQVYAKLRVRSLSALYCQLCLRSQLSDQAIDKQEFIRNSLGLALYYSGMQRFSQAHHCLSACERFVDSSCYLDSAAVSDRDYPTEYSHAAELARGWAAFYLKYFQCSKARLFNEEKEANRLADESSLRLSKSHDPFEDDEDGEEMPPKEEERERLKNELIYANIPMPADSARLEEINIEFSSLELLPSPAFPLFVDHAAASQCFKTGSMWFHRAMNYYILDGFVSDHIALAQDLSQLYKCMAAYESDLSRFTKLEKRRIDLLTDIWKQLSQAAYLEFYQQLADEIAACYSSMCEAKIKAAKTDGSDGLRRIPAAAQQKINQLALKGIEFYQIWLKTWFDGQNNLKFPELNKESDYQRWFFLAHFNSARLFGRIFHEESSVLIQFTKKSLEHYKKCIELANQWPILKAIAKEEVVIAEEMSAVLPVKMDKIAAHGAFQ